MKRFAAFALLLLASCGGSDPEHATKPLVEVRLAVAKSDTLTEQIEAPGLLYPLSQAAVAAKIAAPIQELLVTKGSAVKKDQIVAVLQHRDLEAAEGEARAVLKEAEAALAKLSTGALPGELERAQAQVNITASALDTAQKIFERRKMLVDQGAIPARELLVSQNELAAAQNNHLVAKKNLELLQSQTRERDLEMARSRVEQARARVAQAQAQLAFTSIRSPLDGVVSDQWMYPGDMAKPDAPIVTVMDIHQLIVRAQVPEARAPLLAVGQTAEFAPQDLPGRRFAGRVSVVSPAVDRAARTVEVWVEVDNARRALRAGGYGTLSIAARRVPAVVIPRPAAIVEEGSAEAVALVVDDKNIAHQRKIRIGIRQGELLQVTEGIRPGEKVVAEGNYGLPDGTEVKPR
jgi:RND family efflux transporter MFP subunit